MKKTCRFETWAVGVAAAASLCAATAQAVPSLTIRTSPDQRVAEGTSGLVSLGILNDSTTDNAFVVLPITATCETAIGSPDINDFIMCRAMRLNTTGSLGTFRITFDGRTRTAVQLSTATAARNLLIVDLPFDTPRADVDEVLDLGIELVTFGFTVADGLAEFTEFGGTAYTARARVDVFDAMEPGTLALLFAAAGALGTSAHRRHRARSRQNSSSAVTTDVPNFPTTMPPARLA